MRLAAAVCSLLLGLGFGIPCALGIRHLARTGEVWSFLGFPTYGGGPFERAGLETGVALLVGFLLVCAAEVVIGVALLLDARWATVAAMVLLPVEVVYWVGFALPAGPPLGIARTVLLLLP